MSPRGYLCFPAVAISVPKKVAGRRDKDFYLASPLT